MQPVSEVISLFNCWIKKKKVDKKQDLFRKNAGKVVNLILTHRRDM